MKCFKLLPPLFLGALLCSACGGSGYSSKTSSQEYSFEDKSFSNIYLASNIDPAVLSQHIESKNGKKVRKEDAGGGALGQYFEACSYDSFCYDYHLANGVSVCDVWFFPNTGAFIVRNDGRQNSSLDNAPISYSREMSTHWVFKIGQKASSAGYAGWYTYKAYYDHVAQAWYNATVTLKPSVLHIAVPEDYFCWSYFDNYSADVRLTSVPIGDSNKADQLCRSELNDIAKMASDRIAFAFSSLEDDFREANNSYHLFNDSQGAPFSPGSHVSDSGGQPTQSSESSQSTSQSGGHSSSSQSSSSSTRNTSDSSGSSSSQSTSSSSSIQYDYAEYYDYDGTLLASVPFKHGSSIPTYPNPNPTRPDDNERQLTFQFSGWDFEDLGDIKKYTAKYESCTIGININLGGTVTSYSGTSKDVVIPSAWNGVSVFWISSEAFIENATVESITMPDTIREIYSVSFAGCSSLKTINIGKGVTSIGMRAFRNCISLTSIFIPITVESMGNYVFENCTSLTINCEAESKPQYWDSYWNSSNCPVNWGVSC